MMSATMTTPYTPQRTVEQFEQHARALVLVHGERERVEAYLKARKSQWAAEITEVTKTYRALIREDMAEALDRLPKAKTKKPVRESLEATCRQVVDGLAQRDEFVAARKVEVDEIKARLARYEDAVRDLITATPLGAQEDLFEGATDPGMKEFGVRVTPATMECVREALARLESDAGGEALDVGSLATALAASGVAGLSIVSERDEPEEEEGGADLLVEPDAVETDDLLAQTPF
jgi:hypothetical protein